MKTNRREFLGTAAVAAGGVALARSVHADDESKPLRVGLIGAGWYGMVDAKAALKVGGVEITAVCDVDSEHLTGAADELEKLQGKRPATFKLYEDLLDQDGLEAVIIGTPPQWHALQFIDAVGRGLHVYCEKPLAYDVREGRAMVEAAGQAEGVVQIGFQRRQSEAFKQVRQFIADGRLGELVQVDAQIHYKAGTKDPTPQDPPASLDWDLWCGPAPKIPYSPQVGHHNWRLEKTTGHGHLVDWGIHLVDGVRVMLDLPTPKRAIAAGGIYHYGGIITTPDTLTVHFEFDKVPVVWRHRLWGATEWDPEVNNGLFFYGTEGTVFTSDRKWVFVPRAKNAEREVHEAPADLGTLHMAAFLDAVRTGSPVACEIEDAWRTTTTVQLGMIAHETASTVDWDEAGERIVNNDPAAALLKREYRAAWKHPYGG